MDLGDCLNGVGMKYGTRTVSPFFLCIFFLSFSFLFFSRVFSHALKDFSLSPSPRTFPGFFLTLLLVFHPFDALSFLPLSFLFFLKIFSFISARFFSFPRGVVS